MRELSSRLGVLGLWLVAACGLASQDVGSLGEGTEGSDSGVELSDEEQAFWAVYNAAFCGDIEGCDCSEPSPFFEDDFDQCWSQRMSYYELDLELAHEQGLSFDADCADKWMDRAQASACGTRNHAELEVIHETFGCSCTVYQGQLGQGEPCSPYPNTGHEDVGLFNPCQPGLWCSATEGCIPVGPVCETAEAGAACIYDFERADGSIVTRTRDCPAGHYCNFDTGNCDARPQADEACIASDLDAWSECADGLHCVSNACVPQAELGEDCQVDNDCLSHSCAFVTKTCDDASPVCH